jgi:isopentenyl-diphosphate delta-isomerase
VEKLAVHQRGLRHKAISVFVMDGDRVLIQQRAAAKYHTPGLWANTCCTHPAWEERDPDCAQRRLSQELGITGLALRHVGQVAYRADVGGGLTEDEVVQVFTAQAGPDLALALNPDEVQATRWAALADLRAEIAAEPARFTPWLRIYLDQHSAQIFGQGIPGGG